MKHHLFIFLIAISLLFVNNAKAQTYFSEEFANNSAGWTLDTEWGIGSASGYYNTLYDNDPALDHTSNTNNGIAGANIGGSITNSIHGFYYLTSPVIDLSSASGNVSLAFFRWLTGDEANSITNVVEVFDGTSWQTIWTNPVSLLMDDATWVENCFDITAYKNANFQIRFGHSVNGPGSVSSGGWNVDDISIYVPSMATTPTLSASSLINCGVQNTTLSIASGSLNAANDWAWYTGSCGGTLVGYGTSIVVSPSSTTTYYARGEGVCGNTGACESITIHVGANPTLNTLASVSICVGDSIVLSASGATNYNWAPSGNAVMVGLTLDNIPTPKLAVGLHKLISSYLGNALQLRRSTDNALMDFGFVGNDLDIASIATWLGSADGYCTTLYDQSGNGGHVTQTNNAQQPLFVANGINGKPILRFSNTQFMFNLINYPPPFTTIYGAKQTGPIRNRVLGAVNNNWLLGWWSGLKSCAHFDQWIHYSGIAADNSAYIYSGSSTGGVSSSFYENGNLIASHPWGFSGPNGIELNGYGGGAELSDADFMDVFVFDNELSNQHRGLVETYTNDYYGLNLINNVPLATASISAFPNSTTTYTVTGSDVFGCSSSATVVVNVTEVCPANQSAICEPGQCSASVTTVNPVHCQTLSTLTWAMSGATFATSSPIGINYVGTAIFNKGVTTVTYTATYISGGMFSCSFDVTVTDNEAPVITCSPINLTNTPGICGANLSLPSPTVSDNCPSIGNALNFDGVNDMITGSDVNLPTGTSARSIEAWVKWTSVNPVGPIFQYGTGSQIGGNEFALAVHWSGKLMFWGENNDVIGSTLINDGNWHHVAVTYDGTTIKLYVDGNLDGTGTPSLNTLLSGNFHIGRDTYTNWAFNGSVDEIRFWNLNISQAQIQANMNNELNAQTGLLAVYHFNQGVAGGNNTSPAINTATDLSGNGYNGTLSNFALTGSSSNWIIGNVLSSTSVPMVTNNAPSTLPIGSTNVIWTATDVSGNTATCTQVVTVTDTEAPVFAAPSLLSVDFELGALPSGWTATGLWHISSSCITGTPPNPTKWAYFGLDASCTFNAGSVTGSLSTAPISIPASASNPTLIFKSIYRGEGGAPYDLAALRVNGTQILNVSSSFPQNTWNTVSVNLSSYIGQTITIDWLFNSVDHIGNNFLGWQVDSISLKSSGSGCPANITAYTLQGACNKDVSWTIPSLSDNCAIASLTSNYNPGDLFPIGTTTVVYTATDIHGNSSTCSFDVTVVDTNLFATCPQSITVSTAVFQCTADVAIQNPSFTSCTSITNLSWTQSGSTNNSSSVSGMNYLGTATFNKGLTTVTYTATNNYGHVSHCSFTVQVNDSIPPTITCTPLNVNNTPGLCSATINLINPTVTDNCALQLDNALYFDGVDDVVNTILSDNANSSWTFTAKIKPVSFPGSGSSNLGNTIVAADLSSSWGNGFGISPTNLKVIYNNNWTNFNYTFTANTWYDVAVSIDIANSNIKAYVNGVLIGTNSVSFTTGGGVTNFKIGYFPGVLSNPFDGYIDEVAIWNTVRTQTQIQDAMISNTAPQVGLQALYHFDQGIPLGNNVAVTTLNDASGNSKHGTLVNFALTPGAVSNWGPSSGGSLSSLTNNAPPSYPVGTTNVVWTATDASGNAASCTQIVTVTDTEAPVFTQPSLLSVDFESGALPSGWSATGLWHITSSCITGTPPNPTKWAYFGSDASCNFNVGSVSGSLSAPSITIPASAMNPTLTFKSIYRGEGGTPYDLAALRVNGTQILNVSSSFPQNTWNTVSVNFSAYIGQTITIDWLFNSVDNFANNFLGWQVDSISLQSSGGGCPSNIAAYTLQGACDRNVSWSIPTPSDNCAIATLTSNYNPGDLFPVGTTTVVYTATDIHGNSSTCSFDVTVIDTNLFATCPQNITANTDAFQCAANLLLAVPTFTNCAPINSLTWVLSGATSASSAASGINYLGTTTFNKGTTTVTYTATNSFGHVSHCSFTVQVNDSIPPTIICSPNLIVNHDEGVCGASVNLISPSISDNCPLNLLPNALNFDGVNDHVILPEFNLGTSDFTLETWINPTINSDDYLISNRTSESGGCCNWFALSHQSDGKIYLEVASNGTPNYVSFGSNTAVPLNAWSHIAVVRSGLTMTIYINGVADVIYTDNFVRNVSTGNYVLLGGFPYYDAAWYQGSMDEVRIWNIARTGSQILNNMNTQIPAQSGLQNYYSMNQGIANSNNVGVNTVIDGSGNGYSGSLNNFALSGSTSNWVNGNPSLSAFTNNAPSLFPIGTTNVVWTAADASGNIATCTQIVIVNPPSGSTITAACDSYTWVENNNAVYTVSGNYTQTFTTAYGCDSIHTLNLTVNYSSKTVTTISTIGCYTWPINGGTYTTSGMYTNTYTNGVGCLHTDSLYLTITPEVLLHAKAILQGPYDASIGLMHDSLRVQNAIPTLEPYSQLPYNKPAIGEPGGELLNLSLLTTTGNDAIVDWIFLELRDAINPSIIVATKRALIQRDGDIVSHVDGLSPIHFLYTSAGNYYVSIKHRNHLGVMSSTPIALSACAGSTINFSDLTPVYINPVIQNLPRKNLAGINALWSADANNNKNVKYNGALNDKDKIMTGVGGPGLINNIVYGYRVEDCNMDGKIRYNGLDNDRTLIITNVGVSTPNNVLFQHTPN
ncbi:MAG: HYR domain-containing protein [Bacteroidetes bacterium]|nr:HYR domain-containing protein [Bacteroidota bacterium]